MYPLLCLKKLTHMRQDFLVCCVIFLNKNFPKWLTTIFMRFWKTLPFPLFLILLLPILFPKYFFCDFVFYPVICKPHMKENTMVKLKYRQKTWKNRNFGRVKPEHWDLRKSKSMAIFILKLRLDLYNTWFNMIPQC